MNVHRTLACTLLFSLALMAVPVREADAATIGVGDIVVLGVAGDNTNGFGSDDGFSWAPLIDLDPGDVIFFTDSSWNIQVPGNFNGTEGLIQYTAPAGGVPAGTIFVVDLQSLPPDHVTVGSAETGSNNPMTMSTFGDQLAVFTGNAAAPTFVFAVNTDQTQWTGSTGASGDSRSDLYPGLTDGVNAVAVGAGPSPGDEFDNAYYSGPVSLADKATWLARVSNAANWTGENDGSLVTTIEMTAGFGAMGVLPISSVSDTTPPVITTNIVRRLLWPARRGLLPVGLSASATDDSGGPILMQVEVFSDEADVGPGDAIGTTPASLRLRAERQYPGDGRVYLLKITATDASGNEASTCVTATVPIMPTGAYIVSVRNQAAAAELDCALAAPLPTLVHTMAWTTP